MKIKMPEHLKKQLPPQPNAAVPFLSREPPAEPPTIEPPAEPPVIPPLAPSDEAIEQYVIPKTPSTPDEFIAFCDELAKRGPLRSVSAGCYHVDYQRPPDNSLAEAIESLKPLLEQALNISRHEV